MLPTLLINLFFPPLPQTTTGPVKGFPQSYRFVLQLRLRSSLSSLLSPQTVIDGTESSAVAKPAEDLGGTLPKNTADRVSSVNKGSVALGRS